MEWSSEQIPSDLPGIGDGMQAKGTIRNTEVPAVIAVWINWQLVRDRPG